MIIRVRVIPNGEENEVVGRIGSVVRVKVVNPEVNQAANHVLVTAGASAPESVVQETVAWLVARFGGTVRQEVIREEEVHFPLPKALRQLVKSEGEGAASL